MECKRQETVWTEKLVATLFADGKRGRTAAVMENKGASVVFDVLLNRFNESVGKIAVFAEIVARFEVDNLDIWGFGGVFGFFGKSNQGTSGLGQVKVLDQRGGGAFDAVDFEGFSDETGES